MLSSGDSPQISNIFHQALSYCKTEFGKIQDKLEEVTINLESKPKLYRLPRFWGYYRFSYPFIFLTLFLILMIVALAGWNLAEGHLVLGSILSLLSSLLVIASYVMIIP